MDGFRSHRIGLMKTLCLILRRVKMSQNYVSVLNVNIKKFTFRLN